MKIIELSSHFAPAVGGVERQVEEISKRLIGRGHQVTVLTTNAMHGRADLPRQLPHREVYEGIPVKRFKYWFGFGVFFRFSLGLVWELFRADYDVIHVHNTHDAHLLPAIVVKFLRRKRLVLTGHNPYSAESARTSRASNWFVKFFEFVLKIFKSGIDVYIALLESEKQEVIRRFGIMDGKIIVIPNGIQDDYFDKTGDEEKFFQEWGVKPEKWGLIVGLGSRLNFVKGIQNLEVAAKGLKNVLFIFVGGDDGYGTRLKQIFADCKNVLFTDKYLRGGEMLDFYATLDLFLLPSEHEPFGMTIVEAMAQGLPVLASAVGGPKEIVKPEFGEIIDPHDQSAWKERIQYYSQQKSALTSMGAAARAAAQKYRWDVVIPEIEKVLTKSWI